MKPQTLSHYHLRHEARLMRARSLVPLVAVLPALALGQGPPGTNLRIAVRVARLELRGDTARVEFFVRNDPQSAEELFEFMVEAPAPVVRIAAPPPTDKWLTDTVVNTLSMATWGLLGTHLARGAEAGPLAFEALGLPTIVTDYATGWFPVPSYTPVAPGPPPAPREAILANSVAGQTVGIEPLPADRRLGTLIQRLRHLTGEACTLGWITSEGVCQSLEVNLDRASASLLRADSASARGELQAFRAELAAQHGPEPGKHVGDNAYWLLSANVAVVLNRL